MEETLRILARERTDETVEVLEAYRTVAYTRLEDLVECAWEEAQYLTTVVYEGDVKPMTVEQKVLWHWRTRAAEVRGTIKEIESDIQRDRYEVGIMQRVLDKATDDAARQIWQAEVDAVQSSIQAAEHELAEKQQDLALCGAMIAEIEADLGPELARIAYDPDELPF